MRVGWVAGLMGGAVVGALALNASVIAPRRFRVREHDLALPGWPSDLDGLKVVVVGDVHAGAPFVGLARVRFVAAQVAALRPDLVLLVGDHVADVMFGTDLDPADVAEALTGVTASGAEAVGVLGNHDWYAGGHRIRAAFEKAGLPVLEERAVPVLDGRLWVAGVGDLWERSPSVTAALADVPAGAPTIVMTHNPDCVSDVPDEVALVVAGHTHGGQVGLLGKQVHQVSERSGNRWLRGWYPDVRLYVTGGVGSSLLPLRTVVPEIALLRLSSV